jgi:hypothetical protein
MKRRNFILLSSLAGATILTPSVYFSWKDGLKLPLHLTYIWGRETLLWIGEDYLHKFPSENDENALLKLLSDGGFVNVDKKIREDYEKDRVVVLNGWLLSITEGRQCALLSLTRTY